MSEAAYDPIAELYDQAFADIRVRKVEWGWLTHALRRAPARPRVLEVGCGTGALLRALSPQIELGVGVDVASAMIARAERRVGALSNLSFQCISDARLPFADRSFDVLLSFLSFRYLDWQRSLAEMRRVLCDGGRILLVDLASARAGWFDLPRVALCAARNLQTRMQNPRFARDLSTLTAHPAFRRMLVAHPMKPLQAYRAFFRDHLPEARIELLDVAPTRRVIALDSGPLAHG